MAGEDVFLEELFKDTFGSSVAVEPQISGSNAKAATKLTESPRRSGRHLSGKRLNSVPITRPSQRTKSEDKSVSPGPQVNVTPLKTETSPITHIRCIVKEVQSSVHDKVIKAIAKNTPPGSLSLITLVLKLPWASMDVCEGDIVHIVGPSVSALSQTISFGFETPDILILHPDILVTSTAAASAPFCLRKPILQARFRCTSPPSEPILLGQVLHSVFQACLVREEWDENFILATATQLIRKDLQSWWLLGIDVDEALSKIRERTDTFREFASKFVRKHSQTTQSGELDDGSNFSVTGVSDVEEDIWSPMWGLKGKVDASIMADLPSSENDSSQASITPFEYKTGRWTNINEAEHRAQTMLYTLLMSDRYSLDVKAGVLYYSSAGKIMRVDAMPRELQGLIISRNQLACFMKVDDKGKSETEMEPDNSLLDLERLKLSSDDLEEWKKSPRQIVPSPIDERQCRNCYANDVCMVYRRTVEHDTGGPADAQLSEKYRTNTSHITESQANFFAKWEDLISMEEQLLHRYRAELWTISASDREKMGRCLSEMMLDPSFTDGTLDDRTRSGTSRHFLRFCKSNLDIPSTMLTVGDPVVVSGNEGPYALARGFIIGLDISSVTLSLDHIVKDPLKKRQFRIDKDEMVGGMGRLRDNLTQLFLDKGECKRLQLIVDLKQPAFSAKLPLKQFENSKATSLNESQQDAIKGALSAIDYSLILGMPGTGKTHTIAELIRQIVARGQAVLLTSYQHSAVDNILLRLVDENIPILRLGNADKVLPAVSKYTLDQMKTPVTVAEVEELLMTPRVVATTALSIDAHIFYKRKFDYCIVDEASQLTLPTCIGPLRLADVFVLVGDHYQLPPLVRSMGAKAKGYEVSLFRRLSEAHPSAISYLTHQYRMAEDIMELSNNLIYENRLICGNTEVANQILRLNSRHPPSTAWLEMIISPENRVLFVDTDRVPFEESRDGQLISNEGEAWLIDETVQELLSQGVEAKDIGVIAHYREQAKILAEKMMARGNEEVEVMTADKSQGRDKECILMSFTRSNQNLSVGQLLMDWRRINVCITRPKAKLVVFGSRKTLRNAPKLAQLINVMEERNFIYELPVDVKSNYCRDSQFTGKRELNMSSPNKSPLRKKPIIRSSPVKDIPPMKVLGYAKQS